MEITGNNLKLIIKDGIITEVSSGNPSSNLYISPRFIDLHCHLREPGGEGKETLETGIKSAFTGGYGIVCPMPNTNPVCDTSKILHYIFSHSKNPYDIKLKPICAITTGLTGEQITDFEDLIKNGAAGFSNDGKPVENMEIFKKALIKAAGCNSVIFSHAENTDFPPDDPRSEWTAVERELNTLRKTGGRLHFAHISTQKSTELIRSAKQEGLKVTAETAPHYFTFSTDDITSNDGRFKMNPPLRTKDDVDAIKEGLKDGTVDIIATDHAPHTNEEKLQTYNKSPFGITGFETAFSLAYTNLVLKGILTIEQLIDKLVYTPARIAGIKVYGINPGEKAEFNIIDLNKKYTVKGENFKTKCKITPYEGLELTGKVYQTIIGDKIYNL